MEYGINGTSSSKNYQPSHSRNQNSFEEDLLFCFIIVYQEMICPKFKYLKKYCMKKSRLKFL